MTRKVVTDAKIRMTVSSVAVKTRSQASILAAVGFSPYLAAAT